MSLADSTSAAEALCSMLNADHCPVPPAKFASFD